MNSIYLVFTAAENLRQTRSLTERTGLFSQQIPSECCFFNRSGDRNSRPKNGCICLEREAGQPVTREWGLCNKINNQNQPNNKNIYIYIQQSMILLLSKQKDCSSRGVEGGSIMQRLLSVSRTEPGSDLDVKLTADVVMKI
ncbi:hypothetical protein CHARACLAT_024259 [Characodon lateralis]|uniref:Uncharacterized protein n=1 Tax=Characodon lateralis TaxID=208331 RepID=A0ABU7DCC4_9TELE|nr:hypothetical protein [Characodon lateralis]